MTPHARELIEKAVKSYQDKLRAEADAKTAADIARADIAAVWATNEYGVKAELARRLGVSATILGRDAMTEAEREAFYAKRRGAEPA